MTNEELEAIAADIALALDHQEGVSPPVVSRLVAEVRRLRVELGWYANPDEWCSQDNPARCVLVEDVNGWERAAAALAPESGEDQRR